MIQQFLDYLTNQALPASPATVKNYKADIKRFVTWYQQEFQKEFNPSLVTIQIIDLYKKAKGVNCEDALSQRTLERHLSSLRKFFFFLERTRIIEISPFTFLESQKTPLNDPWKIKEFKEYLYNSSISPLTIKNYVIDIQQFSRFAEEVTKPKEEWDLSKKSVFEILSKELVEDYKKRLLTDAKISPASINRKLSSLRKFVSWREKEIKVPPNLTAREVASDLLRPPLYRRSLQKIVIKYYFHFSILLICIGVIGYGFYSDFLSLPQKNSKLIAASAMPIRVLSFQGRLTNAANAPITSTTAIKFSLYNDPASTGSALLWQENQDIAPDKDGVFSAMLGKQTEIPQSLFAENTNVYIGVTVGQGQELLPRQQIATVGYAANAEVLQGLPPITQAGSGQKNVILALDSSGNLTIGGVASPIFQALGGNLKFSGQQLMLVTNNGSSGNVQIAPDGNGKIDVQKPIVNTTTNGSILPGAVEIDDSLVVDATSSGKATFILNNSSTQGPIFTASSSGVTRFIVDNGGKVGIGGVLTPDTALQVAGAITPTGNGVNDLGRSDLNFKNLYVRNIVIPSTDGIGGYWQLNSGVLSPTYISNDFAIGGTSTSAAKLSISSSNGNITTSGNITGVFSSSSNTERLCWDANGASFITDCSGTPGDYAEQYGSSDPTIEAGDVVSIDTNRSAVQTEKGGEKSSKAWILKSREPYQQSIIGIVSTHPNEVIGKVFDISDNPRAVALNGRVPVKIASTSASIQPGDLLTSSSIPGRAMKANKAGSIIGKALENWTPESGKNSILTFVNISWYDPNVYITSTGDINVISNKTQETPSAKYALQAASGEIINRIGIFNEAVIANLKTGLIEAKQVTTDVLLTSSARIDQITSNLIISPIIEADQLKTDFITPLSSDSIVVNGKIVIASTSTSSPRNDVVLEVQGSASVSGNLSASSASVSGTLRANHILADSIDGLDEKIATLAARTPFDTFDTSNTFKFNNIEANFGIFNLGLIALGGSSFSDVSISNQLSVGSSLKLADNSINVLGADLELQPFRQGGISILSGLIRIDTDGNLSAQGADFAKDVKVRGNLSANIISPLPNQDLILRLGNVIARDSSVIASGNEAISPGIAASPRNDDKGSHFVIQNANDSSVLSIDSKGNLTSSGSGLFRDIISGGLSIVREAQADTSLTETIASGSAGIATIIQGETERTIINPYVKSTSLIYITPTSDTQGATPYIARQTNEDPQAKTKGSFVIQIPQAVYKDIKLNWWIVN